MGNSKRRISAKLIEAQTLRWSGHVHTKTKTRVNKKSDELKTNKRQEKIKHDGQVSSKCK